RVVIGRDVAAEGAEVGVIVPPRQIAQKLIVRAVFLDDVEDVLKDAGLADVLRDGGGGDSALSLLRGAQHLRDQRVLAHLSRVFFQRRRIGDGGGGDAAAIGVRVPC